MVTKAIICEKLKTLAHYYSELEELAAGLTLERYLSDLMRKRAIEREIQLIVECATDVNNMILKLLDRGPARDYFNSFIELAESDVFDMDFALAIAPSTGLRNILVHEYEVIDDAIVFQSIDSVLRYYKEYLSALSEYLDC
ncbi:MAG: DUF86 domain-containing protein [Firmicutes bacterium]|jgi:uncharacterized protein YutE (UPF0331/DUF86 family)|nr:DUF86 domain-containing protein [Bacillota bacterium]